jgi:hypothetical protein
MKKLFRIFLCAAFLLSVSVPVLADTFSSKFGTLHVSPKLNDSMFQKETVRYLDLVGWSALTDAEKITLDENIRLVKFSTGITLASVTCNLSLAGWYGITNSSVDLRPYALISGVQFSVSDGSKAAVLSGTMTAGTGETLSGVELLSNTTYENTTGVTTADGGTLASIAGGQSGNCLEFTSGGVNDRTVQPITTEVGAIYKFSAYHKAGTGGTITTKMILCRDNLDIWRAVPFTFSGSWEIVSNYATARTTGAQFWSTGGIGLTATKTYLSDTSSVQKVLTPDTTGFSALSVADAGINPNSASYTITITKP